MSFPSRSAFFTLFHVFAKAEWSILVSMCAQWPMVKDEVRSKPRNAYGLDPRATRLKRKICANSDFLKHLFHLIPIGDKQLCIVLTDKDQVVKDEKLGMIL
jgi:hypothetical protein